MFQPSLDVGCPKNGHGPPCPPSLTLVTTMPRDAAGTALPPKRPRGPIMTDLIELLRLSGPVVLSRLGIMIMGLSDAIVVGDFSARQLGFHAMAWAPTSVFVTATVGLLVGVQVMTARAMGSVGNRAPRRRRSACSQAYASAVSTTWRCHPGSERPSK